MDGPDGQDPEAAPLPFGDFREWDAIEAWAHEIATVLANKVPVG